MSSFTQSVLDYKITKLEMVVVCVFSGCLDA